MHLYKCAITAPTITAYLFLAIIGPRDVISSVPKLDSSDLLEQNSREDMHLPLKRKLSLREAEELFLKNNLSLISSKFEIEAKKAEILQAQLWDNPSIAIDQNIYNRQTGIYFDTTKNGETAIQIQQLFLMAGKRDKRVRLAKWNKEISEQIFYDTLRSLKLELRTTFFQLHFARQSMEFYKESIPAIKKTISGAENVYRNRNILLSELLRLKSLLFRLENDRSKIIQIIYEKEAALKVLLNEQATIEYEIFPEFTEHANSEYSILSLDTKEIIKSAIEHRPDLKSLELSVKAEQTNLSLQKAMVIPDVALGGSYDRAGNYINNYYGFTVSTSIPLFDRNQGNIKAAEMILNSKKVAYEEQLLKVKAEVRAALEIARDKERLLRNYGNSFTKDYKGLAGLMIENYGKKYITILEFADFFESYSESTLNMIRLQSDRIEAAESLNFSIGKTVAELGK
ncbi:outer membrane efflux protein [Leptospira inadai serovar Lyme str. 10]|uniref:Outer membrane efflux protein n=2 Tax=Leptospira inadai serovar Lyme TaxID=293084 RepID=V6HIA3_9LEPT|nr:TolC family protein [Leptospira inadai]EQA36340.1 outer membrane efflux protein [Leptospira inadai serovar Lyme str. 10]PNV74549.1 TolC family protein [Leptospira inadai serovar Lyme]